MTGNSSARQTLQFEDVDPDRYKHSEPIYLPSSQTEAPSPHRDHPYGVKSASNGSNDNIPPPPMSTNQFREEFIVVQPVDQKSKAKLKPLSQKAGNDENFAPPPEKQTGVNRKEKSLGLLAERMLAGLPENVTSGETMELQLDDTARLLQTERRRIYDIVNVFEAVQIMSKVGKNVYQWHGRTYLVQSLAWLRQLALATGMDEGYRVAREQDIQMMIHNQENVNIENVSPAPSMSPLTPTFSPMASPSPMNSPYNSPNDPNGTSMGINTQKFLMLFLVTPSPQTLTLDFAAKVIHGIHQVEKTRLTRIRRLYDIANILQSLGLIRKVQVTDGRGKKPAFQFIGPDVTNIVLTEEEKKQMPARRQKNSLLAVGRNLVLLPEKDPGAGGSKRARSLSEERNGSGPAKLVRTRSESRVTDKSTSGSAASLFDLSEVCELERQKLATGDNQENVENNPDQQVIMKPPTPGRPPSRKKHLLARYYSDSALLSSSVPRAVTSTIKSPTRAVVLTPSEGSVSVTRLTDSSQHNFTSPRPVVRHQYSPAQISAVPQSPRNNYSPLHPSPLTKQPSLTVPEKQYTPLRSPVTPRDLRNSSILPPNSPQRTKLITCSPMGPVGRSLLSSPASPRAPIDLTVRPVRSGLGRSPLASRSLNLPPTPPEKNDSMLKPNLNENSSPLLRAYLANNKNRIFKPILNCQSNLDDGVSLLPLESVPDSVTLSPSTTISALSLTNSPVLNSSPCSSARSSPPPTTSPDGSTNSSSASELEGIFGGKPLPRPAMTLAKSKSNGQDGTPLDFSGLLSAPPKSSCSSTPSPFSILSLTSPFLNNPRDLTTPHIELASPSLNTPVVPVKKFSSQRN